MVGTAVLDINIVSRDVQNISLNILRMSVPDFETKVVIDYFKVVLLTVHVECTVLRSKKVLRLWRGCSALKYLLPFSILVFLK